MTETDYEIHATGWWVEIEDMVDYLLDSQPEAIVNVWINGRHAYTVTMSESKARK